MSAPAEAAGPFAGMKAMLPLRLVEFEDRLESTAYRFYVMASSMTLRYKIAAALLAVLCLAITSLGAVSFGQQKRVLQREMQKRAEVLVREVASAGKTGLLMKDDLGIYTVIRDIEKSSGVTYALVLDRKGRVFATGSREGVEQILAGSSVKAALETQGLLFQEGLFQGKPVLEASLPIVSRLGAKELRVGTARVGISQADLLEAIHRQKAAYVAITVVFMLFGLVISFALGNLLSRQIVILATAMKVVAQGDLNHTAEVRSRDDIGRLTQTFNDMILKLREKLHMEKYLSQSTLQLIRRFRDTDSLKLGGDRRHVAALFSDVRGFTSMTERFGAEEIVGLINVYLNLQAEVVYQHQGTVDKFVGDEVMAIFTGADCELRAARAAVEIQAFVASLNAARAKAGEPLARVGVGLNSGEVIMGNMGSERQMDYTVIGDAVNVAARLCSAAEPEQTIMSAVLRGALGARCRCRSLDEVPAKGKKAPIAAYALAGAERAERRHRRKAVKLESAYSLAGLSEESRPAVLLDLSEGGCLLETAQPIGIGSQAGLSVALEPLGRLDSVRARARHLRKSEGGYLAGLVFEGLSDSDRAMISRYVHMVGVASAPQFAAG